MPGREKVVPAAAHADDLHEQVREIHRAIVGTTDGSSPGIHRRLDGFESIAKDHEERITEAEETLKTHDRIREERAATLTDHDHRIKAQDTRIAALESAKGSALGRWWTLGLGAAGAALVQIIGAVSALIQAGAHTTPPHH